MNKIQKEKEFQWLEKIQTNQNPAIRVQTHLNLDTDTNSLIVIHVV